MTDRRHSPPLWVRMALRLYPPGFRHRYRAELQRAANAVLAEPRRGGRLRLAWDLVAGAALEWLDLFFRIESPLESVTMRLDSILREARHAARRLFRSPAFAAATILTVAVAIGANTAVFTLVNGVLLRPMPYEEPEELGFVWSGLDWVGIPRAWMAGPHVPFLREHADRFEDFAALRSGQVDLTSDPTQPGDRVMLGLVTGNLFELLGVEAALGRTLIPEEEGPGAPAVAVLTHSLWVERFGADSAVLGRDVALEGSPYRVVGVLPEDFRFSVHSSLGDPRSPDLYIPLDHDLPGQNPRQHAYAVLGRLADENDRADAIAQLDALGSEFGDTHYSAPQFRFRLAPLHPDLVKDVRPALWMLMGAVALVLAIAASNVATLVFGRALGARREVAVRGALGATSFARVGPLLLECLWIATAGAAIGVPLAYAATGGLLALAPAELPRADTIAPDWRVVLFSLATTALVAVVIALAPAIRQRRTDLTESLREGGRTGSARWSGQRGLVVVQVMLCGVLLVGAGLMARSLLRLAAVDPGFATAGVGLADVRVPDYLYEDDSEALTIFERLRERVASRSDVSAAGWTGSAPLSREANQRPFGFDRTPGASGDPQEDRPLTDQIVVSQGYFTAAGIEILEGRGFASSDDAEVEPVVILDESVARRFWPGTTAVGGEVLLTWEDEEETAARVVGVVRHARLYDIRQDDRYQVYRPLGQATARSLTLAVRGDSELPAAIRELSTEIRQIDPRIAVSDVRSIRDVVGEALSSWRFLLQLLGLFAATALGLAMLGLYGVVALSVARQTRTIGIRMALGARAAEVGRSVILQGLKLAVLGLAGALFGAWALARVLDSFLYGVSPLDPLSLGGVALLLAGVASFASWLPARRAARISPTEAFRSE